jgi:hypothetical protein
MALAALGDALADHLRTTLLPAPPLVGAEYPANAPQLPALTLSLSAVTQKMRGLGRMPQATATGALPVTTDLDLAQPRAVFPDEIVELLSGDRRTLTLPHGPLVRADGTATTPFGAGDLTVGRNGSGLTVVGGTPAASEVRPDPDTGTLLFGAPLPATGTLHARYFVGEWEVSTTRYQGVLTLEVFAADAAGVDSLSRAVENALLRRAAAGVPGMNDIAPTGWSATEEAGPGRAGARSRALAYRFDYELIEPRLGTGGGVIADVSVQSTYGPEHFDVH